MVTADLVRDVRDVRADVRDSNVPETLVAQGMCGMCGHWPTCAGARDTQWCPLHVHVSPRARRGARTSRTSRTRPPSQAFRDFHIPHTQPHIPHAFARASFLSSTAFKENGEGGSNG